MIGNACLERLSIKNQQLNQMKLGVGKAGLPPLLPLFTGEQSF
jgi:hypothetical protein